MMFVGGKEYICYPSQQGLCDISRKSQLKTHIQWTKIRQKETFQRGASERSAYMGNKSTEIFPVLSLKGVCEARARVCACMRVCVCGGGGHEIPASCILSTSWSAHSSSMYVLWLIGFELTFGATYFEY